jgi:hypothetical protein
MLGKASGLIFASDAQIPRAWRILSKPLAPAKVASPRTAGAGMRAIEILPVRPPSLAFYIGCTSSDREDRGDQNRPNE